MILPDTSIWIEFFRGREPIATELARLLEEGEILAAAWVFGEILQGTRDDAERGTVLAYWSSVAKVSADSEEVWIEAGLLSAKEKLISRGVGLIDAAIVVAARQASGRVWTLDRSLRAVLPTGLRFDG